MIKHLKRIFFLLSLIALLGNLPTVVQAATSLYVGQSTILSAPNPPSGAALNQTAWGCSNASVSVEKYMTYGAKVKVNSYFTGTAEIRCDYYYYWYDNYGYMHTNNATTYFQITCNPVNLSISPTSMQLKIGEGQSITYSYSPSTVSPQPTIRFLSSNTSVATVNSSGYVKAVGAGNAIITVENSSGPNATCSVKVSSPEPTGISLPESISLVVGESKTITPTVYPSGAQYSLSWSSSNENIATVSSSGSVRGIKAGNVQITAKINGHNLSDYCNVTVEKQTLTLSANPSGGLLEKGSKVSLTANNSNALIYYTLDGSTPNQRSLRYLSPITIEQNLTLNAIAYHNEYNPSNLLTEKYEVTDLEIVRTSPIKDSNDNAGYIIPTISFNRNILEGMNFSEIKLIKNGNEEIDGKKIINNNTLYFVPNTLLKNSSYTLMIPSKSIVSYNNYNTAFQLDFSIKSTSSVAVVGKSHCDNMGVLMSDGELFLWGMNYKDYPSKYYDDVIDFALGYNFIMILKSDYSLWTCGENNHGQLGDGTTINKSNLVKVMDNVSAIAAGEESSYAIKLDGSLWAWGSNNCGQVGNNSNSDVYKPKQIISNNVVSVSAQEYSAVALLSNNKMYRWGHITASGQKESPTFYMDNVKFASAGGFGYHSLFIKNDNSLWRVSEGNANSKILNNVAFATEDRYHSIAIKRDSTLWTWGYNNYGELGNGNSSSSYYSASQSFQAMKNVTNAWTGANWCGAITDDGCVWTWGRDFRGVLGNGVSIGDCNTPQKIISPITSPFLQEIKINTNVELDNLSVGEEIVLQPVFIPDNCSFNHITWHIDDENIASITTRGILSARAIGNTIVHLRVETNEGVFNCYRNISVTSTSNIHSTSTLPLKAYIKNSNLNLYNLYNGDNIMVYNSAGLLVFNGKANCGNISIHLINKGVYIVKVKNHIIKVLNQ